MLSVLLTETQNAGMFVLLGGGLLVIIIAVIVSVVSSVVSAVAANEDIDSE
jgi:ABC-type phosphate transport system permease subunit